MAEIKHLDSKGRLTLGTEFANQTVLIEKGDRQWTIKIARVIPEQEAWLYQNQTALDSLRRGLAQAQAQEFEAAPPDLAAAMAMIEDLEDLDEEE